ncbi:tetratricopeptide repeat protein [Halomonas sp. PAMB 3264]|uniref:tetratricopeptide repeat protein n=1 Tax=Halomonas sp. PAMB 3264 TaxID=3075222 RepID=UPI0028974B44|nr:tetratricopeptide repeat protein [Halomonas sp. PAMB 3264]WNL42987.1 tetratricopeptide repeat protein [Halomonas sp. PAMB 3264]
MAICCRPAPPKASPYHRASPLLAAVGLIGCLCAMPVSAALGANVVPEQARDTRQAREALFEQMMANPADLDLAFRYAALATRAGDLEAAIATLERMLIFAPGLARLQLELGVLYYRLGAWQNARSYLEGALAADNVPPEVIARVEPLLERIAARQSPTRSATTLTVGVRHQSNVNAGPGARTVTLNDIDFLLDDSARRRAGASVFASGRFDYSRDLQSQGDRLESHLLAFATRHESLNEYDTLALEASAGAALDLGRFEMDASELALDVSALGVLLDGEPYLLAPGLNAGFSTALDPRWHLFLGGEYRYQTYQNSTDRPNADERTGPLLGLSTRLEYRPSQRFSLYTGLAGERHQARADYFSHDQIELSLGGLWRFAAPVGSDASLWTLSAGLGYLDRRYDRPDPVFSRRDEQHNQETYAQLGLTTPVSDNTALLWQIDRRNVTSNYDLRDFSNTGVSLAVSVSF